MISNDVVEKYIGHVRKVAESDDEEIKSVISRMIENDPESSDILDRFLSKMDRIMPIEIKVKKTEEIDEDERNEQEDLVGIFNNMDDAISVNDMVEELSDLGYAHPGKVINNAIDDILYIDDVEDDATIYVALTSSGEDLWKENHDYYT
jgi:hypothetical protein